MAVGDSVAAHEAWRRKQRARRVLFFFAPTPSMRNVANPRRRRRETPRVPPTQPETREERWSPLQAAAVDFCTAGTGARAAVARRGPAQLAVDLERVAAAVDRARAARAAAPRGGLLWDLGPSHGRRPGAGRRLAQGAHVQQQPPDDGAPAHGAAEDLSLIHI